MNRQLIIYSLSILCIVLLSGGYNYLSRNNSFHSKENDQQTHLQNSNASSTSCNTEFQHTQQELSAFSSFNSVDDVMASALINGDPGALFVLGLSNEYGELGFSIDFQMALQCYGLSASLGFAPALNKLQEIYFFDKEDIFLATVYLNLTVASGHDELLQSYYEARKLMIEKLGQKRGKRVIDAVERVAQHKKSLMIQLQEIAKNMSGKFMEELGPEEKMNILTVDDSHFDEEFWKCVYYDRLGMEVDDYIERIESI